jgi:hypothetical protein
MISATRSVDLRPLAAVFSASMTMIARSVTRLLTRGLARPASSAGFSKCRGPILTNLYSPPTFIAILWLSQATRTTVAGCVLGVALVLGLLRLARGLLFGVAPTDPLVVAVAVAAPLAVALAAAYLPGRDAARTDPAETLRNGQPGIS